MVLLIRFVYLWVCYRIGFITLGNLTPINAIEALREMNVSILDDVAIAAVGGDEMFALSDFPITSAVLPIDTIIREATVMLCDQIENKNRRRGPMLCPCQIPFGNTIWDQPIS